MSALKTELKILACKGIHTLLEIIVYIYIYISLYKNINSV